MNESSSSSLAIPAIYWPSWRTNPVEITITEFCSDGHVQTTTEGKLPLCFCYEISEKKFIFEQFHAFCAISRRRSRLKQIKPV